MEIGGPGGHQHVPWVAGEGGRHTQLQQRVFLVEGRESPVRQVLGDRGALGVHWRAFLSTLRARHSFHPDSLVWSTTRVMLHRLVRDGVRRPGLGCALLRWQAWRRYRASQLRRLGAPTLAIFCGGAGPLRNCCGSTGTQHRSGCLLQGTRFEGERNFGRGPHHYLCLWRLRGSGFPVLASWRSTQCRAPHAEVR